MGKSYMIEKYYSYTEASAIVHLFKTHKINATLGVGCIRVYPEDKQQEFKKICQENNIPYEDNGPSLTESLSMTRQYY